MSLIERGAAGRGLVAVCIIGASGLAGGCVAFRGGDLEETRPWPPKPPPGAKKPSVGLFLKGQALTNRERAPLSPMYFDQWCSSTREVYLDSGLFSEVLDAGEGADVKAEIEALKAESFWFWLALVSGCTGMAVPCWSQLEFEWKTTFKDRRGEVLGVIRKQESMTLIIQTVLVIGSPFVSHWHVERRIFKDLNRSTLLDAVERRYLDPERLGR
jgi:hypothetical protein